jgi:hydrophobic/amphiphilic exporter-1 (mainly G- bacteria), HAE1 family
MLKIAIQRPIAVSMFFAALLLIGGLGFARLPVDLLPAITYPRLTVITTYDDIPAQDLERLVTQPLEEVITALAGVRGVVSRTREGVSTITVEYEWGTQMDFANLNLREAIDRVAFRDNFPEAAERPVILRWDPTSRPISILVLEGEGRIQDVTEFAREVVKPALEQVDGVSQAELVGGSDREILVMPDPRKLAVYGIQIADISAALSRSNVNFPGGKVRQGPLYLSLRIDGEFQNLDQIRQTDIIRPGRSAIRVQDVADVIDTVKEPAGVTLLGSHPVVSLLIYKEPEANTRKVSEAVDVALDVVRKDYVGIEFSYVYRDAEYINASFEGLRDSLLLGGVLAILVLFLFLSDARSPIVIAVSIPVSIVITFGLLYFGGVNLNLMSLGGLSLAAGMLVDNAIVVLENINRRLAVWRQEHAKEIPGEDPAASPAAPPLERRAVAAAALTGTAEMARPVIAATLTTIAVFFPVVYVPGIAGAFFRDQALTVTLALTVSIAAALLLQPVLAARVLSVRSGMAHGIFRIFDRGFARFHDGYHTALVGALHRRALMFVFLFAGLALATWLSVDLDRSFLPERTQGDMRVDLELPAGTPLEETQAVAAELGAWIAADPAVRSVFTQVGSTERTLAALQDFTAPHTARVRVILEPARDAWKQGERLQEEIDARLQSTLTNSSWVFRQEGIGLGELLASGGARFELGVIAEDPLEALRWAERIEGVVERVDGLTELRIDRVLGTPNVVVQVNREEVLRSGLDPDRIALELRNRIAGTEATTFNEVEQRIDIAVRFAREQRQDLAAALSSPITLANGQRVPLSNFLVLEEEIPVRELMRNNQRRMVTLSGDVSGRSIDAVWRDVEAEVAALGLPPRIRVIETGERQEMQRSFRDLGLAMVLAILLVYMILAAQFESFLDPLLIAGVIPVGLAGSAIAIALTHGSVNILSLIGVLALLGISVNDAIVKVDTIRRLREEGMEGWDAIMEASRLRLRPILMTSVTTVLAMLPMAIGLGSGEQLQRPLAITIIGGLTLTTAMTIFFTPLFYMTAHRIRPRRESERAAVPIGAVTEGSQA